jgi:hypothetical protein
MTLSLAMDDVMDGVQGWMNASGVGGDRRGRESSMLSLNHQPQIFRR